MRVRRKGLWTRAATLMGVASLLVCSGAGCSSPRRPVELTVTPAATRMDEPVSLHVADLEPGTSVDLVLRSTDAGGTTWTSRATFAADASGSVDPHRAAPTAGSYSGTWGMGLFAQMVPSASESGYRWPASGPSTFEVTAEQRGRAVAAASLARTMWVQRATTRTFTKAKDGFVGTYVRPAGIQRGPAVLVLGGSEGGEPRFAASTLAARGVPALAVAYFKAPGLPSDLHDIPLEYFDAPLRWLRRQPEVDPARVWISGGSRGSEAAALVAAGRPDLVHGLIDLSPASVARCAYVPSTRQPCPGPAWTRAGRAVPSTKEPDEPAPLDVPDAVLQVEKVDGPVLTLCGGQDQVWSSCRYSDAIQERLTQHGFRFAHQALSYPDAGHAVDLTMPFEPVPPPPPGALPTYGSTPTANEQARSDAWPKLLAFIEQPR